MSVVYLNIQTNVHPITLYTTLFTLPESTLPKMKCDESTIQFKSTNIWLNVNLDIYLTDFWVVHIALP